MKTPKKPTVKVLPRLSEQLDKVFKFNNPTLLPSGKAPLLIKFRKVLPGQRVSGTLRVTTGYFIPLLTGNRGPFEPSIVNGYYDGRDRLITGTFLLGGKTSPEITKTYLKKPHVIEGWAYIKAR